MRTGGAILVVVIALAGCDASAERSVPSTMGGPSVSATGTVGPSPASATFLTSPPSGRTDVFIAAFEAAPEDPMPGGQLVVVVNGGADSVDITCWSLASKARALTARVVGVTKLDAGAAARLIPDTTVMGRVDELTLYDRSGRRVDSTPRLADEAGDDRLWHRSQDGSWKFGRGAQFPTDTTDGRLAVDSKVC